MNRSEISYYSKQVKNDNEYRNHVVAGFLEFSLGILGVHRIYMKKPDFIWNIILLFLTSGLYFYVLVVNAVILLTMSDKRFNMMCQAKTRKLERIILRTKAKELDNLADELGMVIPQRSGEVNETESIFDIMSSKLGEINTKTYDTVGDTYKDKHAVDSAVHEHIKEDKYLQDQINNAQNKLDRFKSNDYFPSTSQKMTRRDKEQKIKELKEELKGGLISKDEYNEEMMKLDFVQVK